MRHFLLNPVGAVLAKAHLALVFGDDPVAHDGGGNQGEGDQPQRPEQEVMFGVHAFNSTLLKLTTRPGWRNGRRGGFKIPYPKGCVGSNPTPGTGTRRSLGRLFGNSCGPSQTQPDQERTPLFDNQLVVIT